MNEGFPGGSVVGRPYQRRGHGFDPWSGSIPHAVKQLSLGTKTAEPKGCGCWGPWALEPMLCSRRNHYNERPACCSWRVATPTLTPGNERKPTHSNQDQHNQK